jgi:hypothetical protein
MKKISAFLIVLTFFTSCEFLSPDSQPALDLSEVTIKSGQSFGFCIGKCHSEMTIKNKEVEFLVKERSFETGVLENKEYIFKENLATQTKEILQELIDTEKIFGLQDTYGCPDCADGGSEWIEIISSGDKSKKITFEFGKNIPEIEKLINLLRKERETLHNKYAK